MERTAPIPGYLDCYVTYSGKVYKDGKLKVPIIKKGKAPKVRLQENGLAKEYGLATLVAQSFVPNTSGYTKVICKDGKNYNCCADNLRWVSNQEAVRHSLFPGKPLEPPGKPTAKKLPPHQQGKVIAKNSNAFSLLKKEITDVSTCALSIDLTAVPLPGFTGYSITPCGKVYSKDRLLTPQHQVGKGARVKVKSDAGVLERHTVAWLLATAFIANRELHPKVVFKDKCKSNIALSNLQWVSGKDYHRFYRTVAPKILNSSNRSKAKKKTVKPVWVDPYRVPIEDFPGYFISSSGIVYKGSKLVKPVGREGKAYRVRLRRYDTRPATQYFLGLAKLVAQHFIPNPKDHEHVIFKDRDNHNCCSDNIAWVDGETFVCYSGLLQKGGGRKKIIGNREEAATTCTYEPLRNYYLTADDYWLQQCWDDMEQRLQYTPKWEHLRSDCYLYFIGRVQRYSITRDPVGLMVFHLKGLKAKLRQEISVDIPYRLLMQTDESLRSVDQYALLED